MRRVISKYSSENIFLTICLKKHISFSSGSNLCGGNSSRSFDQSRAQIVKVRYEIRQARKSLQALEGQVRDEVTSELERIHFHQAQVQTFREKIIPLRERAMEYAERWVSATQLNRL